MTVYVNWEWVARRLLVLSSYGYTMDYFAQYLDDPEFLTNEWLEEYWGEPLESYVADELDAIDLLMSMRGAS